MEKVIFTLSFQELVDTLDEIELEKNKHMLSQKAGFIISFLNAIKKKNIPSDSGIIEILETGTSQMIKILIDAIKEYKVQLNTRFSTLLIMLESEVAALNEIAKAVFESLPAEEQKKLHSIIIDSPDKKVYSYGLTKLYELYEKPEETIPEDFVLQMLEHTSPEVKAYISDKVDKIITNLGNGNRELFMYYVKTLLFLPNRVSAGKENIYKVLPEFVLVYREKQTEIEDMLLDLGSSNIILDSERALVALAKIKKEVLSIES